MLLGGDYPTSERTVLYVTEGDHPTSERRGDHPTSEMIVLYY